MMGVFMCMLGVGRSVEQNWKKLYVIWIDPVSQASIFFQANFWGSKPLSFVLYYCTFSFAAYVSITKAVESLDVDVTWGLSRRVPASHHQVDFLLVLVKPVGNMWEDWVPHGLQSWADQL